MRALKEGSAALSQYYYYYYYYYYYSYSLSASGLALPKLSLQISRQRETAAAERRWWRGVAKSRLQRTSSEQP